MGKKSIYAVIAFLCVLSAVGIILPFLISSDAVRQNLIDRAKQITGREMKFSGTPKVLFSPFLGIEINDVVFEDQFGEEGSTPILTMPKLQAKLSLSSALTGNVTVTDFKFIRPRFNLKLYSTGQSSWQFPEGKMWTVLEGARALRDNVNPGDPIDINEVTQIMLGGFSIQDGVVEYEDEIIGSTETVTSINGEFDWPHTQSAWNFTGSGIWRGDVMQIQTRSETPIMLLAGGQSETNVSLQSEPINLNFTGTANRFSDLFFNGKVEVTTPSFRRFVNLLGAELPAGSTFGSFSSSATVSGILTEFSMEEAEISLDGNEATGSLNFATTENFKKRLTGTLAFNEFNIDPYLLLTQSDKNEKLPAALELTSLADLELDLRVSAPLITSEVFSISNFAGGLKGKDGEFSINIGNAEIADGLLVGDLSAAPKEDELSIGVKLNISNVEIEKLSSFSTFGKIKPKGFGEVDLDLKSIGSNSDALIRNMTGETNFSFKDGEITGLNLVGVKAELKNTERSSASNVDVSEDISTSFSSLDISAVMNRGVSWITKGTLISESLSSNLAGKIDLHLGTLALRGQFFEANEEKPEEPKLLGKYFIGGTANQPLYVLE